MTITADNQTKVYGAALPTLTASYSGLVNGDTPASLTTPPTLTTTATASSVAGSPYPITASAAVDPDYAITYVPGILNVVAVAGPGVTSVQRYGFHMEATYLVLYVNGPLDPTSAQDTANYTIAGPNRRGGLSRHRIAVGQAIYDAAAGTVTLKPKQRLNVHLRYELMVNGADPSGLKGPSGTMLQAAGIGQPGTDYATTITFGNLAGRASQIPNAGLLGLSARKLGPGHGKAASER